MNPESGVVGPKSSFPIEVVFKPVIEETVSHNIICRVKRKEHPLALKVKGEGYKVHAQLFLKDSAMSGGSGGDRLLQPGVKETVDFGANLQVHEKRQIQVVGAEIFSAQPGFAFQHYTRVPQTVDLTLNPPPHVL